MALSSLSLALCTISPQKRSWKQQMTSPPMRIWELRCPKPPERKKVKSLTHVQVFVTPWTVTYQTPRSMGFFQAQVLEWVAISFSKGSSQPRDEARVFLIADRCFILWATRKPDSQSFGCFHLPLIAEVLELSGCSFLIGFNGTRQVNGFQSWPGTNFIIVIIEV